MREPRVLLLTDSLSIPRLKPEPARSSQVWSYRLAAALKHRAQFFFYTIPGLHTSAMVQNLDIQLGAFEPDIIVTQVGIVDCSPRTMTENERKVVNRLPRPLRKPILSFVRRHYREIIRLRRISYVTPRRFEENWRRLREYFSGSAFIVVPIAPASDGYRRKNPLIDENIRAYNAVLKEVFGDQLFEGAYEGVDEERLFMSDNHHLSRHGHEVLAERLQARLEQALSGPPRP